MAPGAGDGRDAAALVEVTPDRTFAEPPAFIVVCPDEVRVSTDGEVPVPLRSIEELTAAAAYQVAGDPEAPFVLVVETGSEPGRMAEA